jgi:hypothetical protein
VILKQVFTLEKPATLTRFSLKGADLHADVEVDPPFRGTPGIEYIAVAIEGPEGWRGYISHADDDLWIGRYLALKPFRRDIVAALKARGVTSMTTGPAA